MNKRIIIVGRAAAGKDFLKRQFIKRGFIPDVSYTTRPPRVGEINGQDYNFISEEEFFSENLYDFYEYAKHGDYYYATGQDEWENCDIFIMETDGISKIDPADRDNCFVIYLNPPVEIREKRLREERGWDENTILHRINSDENKFRDFKNFDIEIKNSDF